MKSFVLVLILGGLLPPTHLSAQSAPEILKKLSSKDASEVVQQLSDLVSKPSDDLEVARKMIQLLDDDRTIPLNGFFEESVQRSAFIAIGKLGENAIPAIVAEIDLLKTLAARTCLLRAIRDSQKASEPLYLAVLPYTVHDDEQVRGNSIEALSKVAVNETAFIELAALMLRDGSDFVKASTILALQEHPNPAGGIVEQIAPLLLGNEKYYVGVSDHAFMQRRLAADVAKLLGQIGTPAQPSLQTLLKTMRTHEDLDVRVWAAVASIQLSSEPMPEAIQLIGDLMLGTKPDGDYAADSLDAIIVLGEKAESLLETLRTLATNTDDPKRLGDYRLAKAFYAVSPRNAFEDVLKLVAHPDPFVSSNAIEELSKHRAKGDRVIAAYIAALGRDELSTDQKFAALEALAAIGSEASAAVPAVRELLDRDDVHEYERSLILKALGSIQSSK